MTNRDPRKIIIQSFIITSAKGDLSVWENRIKLAIVRNLQFLIKDKKVGENRRFEITKDMYGYRIMEMRTEDCMPLGDTSHHNEVIKAAKSMHEKTIILESKDETKIVSIISMPKFNHRKGTFTFVLDNEIYETLLDFTKGHSRFNVEVAMSLSSKYSQRIYELLASQEHSMRFSVEYLKELFQIEDKYKQVGHLKAKVLKTAQEELNQKAPVSFTFKPYKVGRTIEGFIFTTIKTNNIQKHFLQDKLTFMDIHKSLYKIGFTQKGIANNGVLFAEFTDKYGDQADTMLSEIVTRAEVADNPCGYVINAMKKALA